MITLCYATAMTLGLRGTPPCSVEEGCLAVDLAGAKPHAEGIEGFSESVIISYMPGARRGKPQVEIVAR